MACADNITYYKDPGSGICRSCYHVCDKNIDPGLERDCKCFCQVMYKKMKEADSIPPGVTESVLETAAQTLPPWAIALFVIVFFLTVVVGIMLLQRHKSSPCIKAFQTKLRRRCCLRAEHGPATAVVMEEVPTSNGHMPLRQMTQGASVALEERPTRATAAAPSGAAASRTTNATAGTSRNNRTPATEPLYPSQAASRPEQGSRAPLLGAQGGGSPPRQRARHDPEVLVYRISDASSALRADDDEPTEPRGPIAHPDEPTEPRGPITNPEDTEGPSARLFS